MEQTRLMECVERIEEHSEVVSKALNGLEMLHGQGEKIVASMEDGTEQTFSLEQIHEKQRELFIWIDLMGIILNHAKTYGGFIREETCEILTDGFKDLSAYPVGAARKNGEAHAEGV